MKFQKQRETFAINTDLSRLIERSSQHSSKHGPLLPSSIRCIICGPSNCGKTCLMFSLLTEPRGLRFANLYIFSKSLHQPKYSILTQIMSKAPEIGYYTFENNEDVQSPSEARPNSVFVFDDVACDRQDHMRAYFSMGRHKSIDCFYLAQSYTRIPKHLLRDNANLIILFKQDELNLKHVYDDHVSESDMTFNQFKDLCIQCWNKDRHSFVVISKDDELNKGRYRCGLDTFVTDINKESTG